MHKYLKIFIHKIKDISIAKGVQISPVFGSKRFDH